MSPPKKVQLFIINLKFLSRRKVELLVLKGFFRKSHYWDKAADTFYMLTVYKKSSKEDLSRQQLKVLRQLVEEWLK